MLVRQGGVAPLSCTGGHTAQLYQSPARMRSL